MDWRFFFLTESFSSFHEINTTHTHLVSDENRRWIYAETNTRTKHSKPFSETKELVLRRTDALCYAYYESWAISFVRSPLSPSVCARLCVCVRLRVLNIYDDDQLYQNVGKSIKKMKIDGSNKNSNNGATQGKRNQQHRTTKNNERMMNKYKDAWMNERKKACLRNGIACGAMLTRKTCGSFSS